MEKQQRITACAFVYQDNKLFIAKRADTKAFLPGRFELPGGHVEYGETLEDGLRREFKEEFGAELLIEEPYFAFTYMHGDNHNVEIDYFARFAKPDQEISLNPQDHSEYRWVDEAVLDQVWEHKDDEYKAIKKGFELLKKK